MLSFVGEWWNRDVMEVYREAVEMGGDPVHSDAYTINGQPGYLYPCSKSGTIFLEKTILILVLQTQLNSDTYKLFSIKLPIIETFKMLVEQGRTYLLQIINAAMDEQLFFSIAQHRMTLVGIDGSYTKALATDYVMISPGQTMDVLIEANQPRGCYAMAVSAFDNGMGSMGHMMDMDSMSSMGSMPAETVTTSFFQYTGSPCSPPSSPTLPSLPAYNDSHAANKFTSHLANHRKNLDFLLRDVEEHLFFTLSANLINCGAKKTCKGEMGMKNKASINNISFVNPQVDVLQAYYYGLHGVYDEDFPGKPTLKFNYTGKNMMDKRLWEPKMGTKVKVLEYNTLVEIVFQGTSVVSGESHPMHLHGHRFYVVGWGFGNFDPKRDPLRYNLKNPPHMSTVAVPKNGWTAIRFRANNPGKFWWSPFLWATIG